MSTPNLRDAYAAALQAAADLLRSEARKHDEAGEEVEDPISDEAFTHVVEARALRERADKILALPNPYPVPWPLKKEIRF